MVWFIRLVVTVCIAFISGVAAFLAIFVPLLIRDEHYAAHDGQGGMGGFFLGLPIAAIVVVIVGVVIFKISIKRRWFETREVNHSGGASEDGSV